MICLDEIGNTNNFLKYFQILRKKNSYEIIKKRFFFIILPSVKKDFYRCYIDVKLAGFCKANNHRQWWRSIWHHIILLPNIGCSLLLDNQQQQLTELTPLDVKALKLVLHQWYRYLYKDFITFTFLMLMLL